MNEQNETIEQLLDMDIDAAEEAVSRLSEEDKHKMIEQLVDSLSEAVMSIHNDHTSHMNEVLAGGQCYFEDGVLYDGDDEIVWYPRGDAIERQLSNGLISGIQADTITEAAEGMKRIFVDEDVEFRLPDPSLSIQDMVHDYGDDMNVRMGVTLTDINAMLKTGRVFIPDTMKFADDLTLWLRNEAGDVTIPVFTPYGFDEINITH